MESLRSSLSLSLSTCSVVSLLLCSDLKYFAYYWNWHDTFVVSFISTFPLKFSRLIDILGQFRRIFLILSSFCRNFTSWSGKWKKKLNLIGLCQHLSSKKISNNEHILCVQNYCIAHTNSWLMMSFELHKRKKTKLARFQASTAPYRLSHRAEHVILMKIE